MKATLCLPVVRVLLAAFALALVSCASSGAYKHADNRSVRPVDPFPFHNPVFHRHNNCHPL